MAFLSDTPPFQPQQSNIANFLAPIGGQAFGGGIAGQQNLANLFQQLFPGTYGAGVGTAGSAAGNLGNLGELFAALGLGNVIPGAESLLGQAVQTETTGTLPQGAQDIVASNLQQRQAAIRGKYAQLGMTGSTDETNELDQAQRQSVQDQFTISQNLGQLLGGQALQFGNLGAVLSQLASGALGTAGNIGTTLGQLGLSGLNLTAQDFQNIVSEAFNSLGLSSGIYGTEANQQIATDKNLSDLISSFFKAFGAGGGLPKPGQVPF